MLAPLALAGNNNNSSGVLILDGITLLGHEGVRSACHLRYFLTLEKDECLKRRVDRAYDPPDPPGYFDKVVWPEYERHKECVFEAGQKVTRLDGSRPLLHGMKDIVKDIVNKLVKD